MAEHGVRLEPEEKAFRSRMRNWTDDTSRSVFADWLDERDRGLAAARLRWWVGLRGPLVAKLADADRVADPRVLSRGRDEQDRIGDVTHLGKSGTESPDLPYARMYYNFLCRYASVMWPIGFDGRERFALFSAVWASELYATTVAGSEILIEVGNTVETVRRTPFPSLRNTAWWLCTTGFGMPKIPVELNIVVRQHVDAHARDDADKHFKIAAAEFADHYATWPRVA